MADNNSDNIIPNKPVENRDELGRFGAGNNANPNGRPKKGFTLTDIVAGILDEELPDGNGVTRKEALMRKVAKLAFEGDQTMIKLLWNYIDGLPMQRTELSGPDGERLEIKIIEESKDDRVED